ncbi:MAG TPA: hypothetical protein VIP29_08175 [Nitrososphaeraceae archaeon]
MSRRWWIVGMITVISTAVFITMQYTYGLVDGDNNGKDDVKEWWDASDLDATDWENQKER